MLVELVKKIKSSVGKEKLVGIVAMLGLLAMVLLLLSECGDSKTAKISEAEKDAQEYREQLEDELQSIISSISGAGHTKVMVTLQGSYEYVYAQENKSSSNSSLDGSSSDKREESENSYIIIDTDEGEKALVRTELFPPVAGVVVVCEGADDEIVRNRIVLAVTTALDISSKRVCVILLSN